MGNGDFMDRNKTKMLRGKGILRRLPMLVHNRDGFTLVELMVVIALIGIIAGFGTPALLSMKAKSSVRADARDILSTFKHAQSEAVKRSENVCILFNTPATGYTVFLDNGAGTPANADNAYRGPQVKNPCGQSSASGQLFCQLALCWKSRF